MTRIVLFVGQSKTGTTTLQRHLAASADTLRRQGVLYPRGGRLDGGAAHHPVAAAFLRAEAPPAWTRPVDRAQWRAALDDEWRDSGAHTIVLASEMLLHADPAALDAALPAGERRVVVALRRQDHHLDATLQQKLKTLQFRDVPADWLSRRLASGRLDYDALLRRWEAAVGTGALRVLPFEPALFPDGLVHRLFELGGLAPWPGMAEPPADNVRLGRDALALLQRLHYDLGLDRRRALSLRAPLAAWSATHREPAAWRYVTPPDVRRAVLAAAAEGNAAIHARHPWPGRPALFADDPVDDDWAPYPGLPPETAARLRDALCTATADPDVRAALDAAAAFSDAPAAPRR